MGIVKVRRLGPGKANHASHFSSSNTVDELAQDDGYLSDKDGSDDPDDFEPSDNGCEHALVNDQISNIPYELYELSDLKEILCLETWNLCLTEEEKFHLTSFLPDMDQETFELTMVELLGGRSLFFGSPLETIFRRLKGGFYSPQVSRFREGSKFLKERIFYHSLRSYHDSLSHKFTEMRKAWSICQPDISVEERIQIWNDKRYQKPVFMVDLNAVPLDEELSSKGDKKVKGLSLSRKPAFINEDIISQIPAMDWNGMPLNRTKAKGVLKIKPPEKSSTPKQVVLSLPMETLEPYGRPPKGVLKIKPKVSSTLERSRTNAVPLVQSSPIVFSAHASVLPPSYPVSHWQEERAHRFVRDESAYRGAPIPVLMNGQLNDDALNIGYKLFNNAQSFLRKTKAVQGIDMPPNDSSDFRDFFDGQHKAAFWSNPAGLQHSAFDNSRRKLMPFHSNVPEAISRNSIAADDHQMLPAYPDRPEHRHGDKNGRAAVDRGSVFPLTYKRKKPHTKSLKIPSMVARMEPAAPAGAIFDQVEKTKSLKIRVKGWNEFNSHYKQQMMDGHYHDSSST